MQSWRVKLSTGSPGRRGGGTGEERQLAAARRARRIVASCIVAEDPAAGQHHMLPVQLMPNARSPRAVSCQLVLLAPRTTSIAELIRSARGCTPALDLHARAHHHLQSWPLVGGHARQIPW